MSCSAHAGAAGVVGVLLIWVDCCISAAQHRCFLSRSFKLTLLSRYKNRDILSNHKLGFYIL